MDMSNALPEDLVQRIRIEEYRTDTTGDMLHQVSINEDAPSGNQRLQGWGDTPDGALQRNSSLDGNLCAPTWHILNGEYAMSFHQDIETSCAM